MASFLRVWDALSAAGVVVVGNGISDTHGSMKNGWYGREQLHLMGVGPIRIDGGHR
jgi:hypothetical protein